MNTRGHGNNKKRRIDMLNTEKSVTFSGKSIIDGKEAEGYTAVIKSENPRIW